MDLGSFKRKILWRPKGKSFVPLLAALTEAQGWGRISFFAQRKYNREEMQRNLGINLCGGETLELNALKTSRQKAI